MAVTIRGFAAAACVRCGRPGALLHTGLTDRILEAPGEWSIRRCEACRLAWLDPQPHPDDLGALYQGAYMTHEQPPPQTPGGLLSSYASAAYGYGATPHRAWRWARVLPLVDDVLGGAVCWLPAIRGGRLLDVGCGNGALLARLRAFGWTVCGVEPDPAAAAVARDAHGLEVVTTLGSLGGREFDAVTMQHVIEHLPDPPATLAEIARHLVRGGRLVVVTPNIESLGGRLFGANWVHWDPPRHLWLFSLPALGRLIEEAGLTVERGWTTARYARFAGTSAVHIARSGRVAGHAPTVPARIVGAGFQIVEHVARLVAPAFGEEIVVVARRR